VSVITGGEAHWGERSRKGMKGPFSYHLKRRGGDHAPVIKNRKKERNRECSSAGGAEERKKKADSGRCRRSTRFMREKGRKGTLTVIL